MAYTFPSAPVRLNIAPLTRQCFAIGCPPSVSESAVIVADDATAVLANAKRVFRSLHDISSAPLASGSRVNSVVPTVLQAPSTTSVESISAGLRYIPIPPYRFLITGTRQTFRLRTTRLLRFQNIGQRIGVQAVDECGAMREHRALIDRTFVGDFAFIE